MIKIKKVVIPVAGLGTRMLPATKIIPKEMLPIVDKPLIHYAVDEALAAGIEKIIFVTSRGKNAVEDYFDHTPELEAALIKSGQSIEPITQGILEPGQICYVRQQQPLGLGHAIWCARNIIGDEPFAVILPDDLLVSKDEPCLLSMIRDYNHMHSSADLKDLGTMVALQEVAPEMLSRYGVVETHEKNSKIFNIKRIVEKPEVKDAPSNLAVVGRYIIAPQIFDVLEKNIEKNKQIALENKKYEIQLTTALDHFAEKGKLCGWQFTGRRFDCGTKEDFILANLVVGLQRPDMHKLTIEYCKQILNL